MMVVEGDELAAEIKKIVTVPYAVCLKPLHNILRRHDAATIRDWTIEHEDEVPGLASAVIQALPLWSYTLDILALLATSHSIRDAILQKSPGLLNQLLERSAEATKDQECFISICVSFLSEPLPSGLPLPASSQTLLSHLFEKAMSNPSVATVEPVYALLDGACSDLLELLPQANLDHLRDQLTQMMRTAKRIEEQPLSLYCLAIIAKLNSFHCAAKEYAGRRTSVRFTASSQPGRDASTHSWEDVQKFYHGDRALKTIHLLVLQVIYACRTEGKESDHEAIKHVRLSREVLTVIETSIRDKWVATNGAIVKKMHEKVGNGNLQNALLLEAFAFSSMFNASTSHTSTAASLLVDNLLEFRGDSIDRHSADALSTALPVAISYMDEVFWTTFVKTLSQTATELGPSRKIRVASTLLERLTIVLRSNNVARTMLAKVLATESTQRLLRPLLHHEQETLPQALNSVSRDFLLKLTIEICILIVEVTYATTVNGTAAKDDLASMALNKLKKIAHRQIETKPPRVWASAQVPLVEQYCTPEEQGASHDWQQRLNMELNFDSRHRQESITRLIGQICRDLQERCDNVEKPLRVQEAKYEGLRSEFTKLEARAEQVENQLICEAAEVQALQRSKAQVQDDLENALSECDAIMQDKISLEATLQQTRNNNAHDIDSLKRDLDSQNLELRTTLACNEEKLDEQQSDIAQLKQQLVQLQQERAKEQEQAMNEKAVLEKALNDSNTKLQNSERCVTQQREDMVKAEKDTDRLQGHLSNLRHQLQQLEAQSAQHLSEAADARQDMERELQTTKAQHEIAIVQANQRLADLEHEFANKLEANNAQLSEFQSRMIEQMQNKDATISDLQRKAQKYFDECQKRAMQLEEAQRMKTRLLTAMGLESGDMMAPAKAGGPQQHARRKSSKSRQPSPDPTQDEIEGESVADFDVNEEGSVFDSPSASHGLPLEVSQKARARAAFKVPTMRRPESMTNRSPRRRQSAMPPALSDASTEFINRNMSPRRRSDFVSAKLGVAENSVMRRSKYRDENDGMMFD